GKLFEHVLEHGVERMVQSVAEDAVLLRLALRGLHFLVELGLPCSVALLGPLADPDEMIAQARARVAERPRLAPSRAAIDARIVRGRMALGTIGEELDQRRPGIRAGAVGRPALGGVDRKRVVAVDAQAGDAVALRPSGKGRALSPGDAR